MPIKLITGDGDFLARQALNKYKSQAMSEFGLDAVEQFDASEREVGDIVASFAPQSLFSSGDKLVVIDRPMANTQLAEKLLELIQNQTIPTTTMVLLYEPNIDRRSKLFKSFLKNTLVEDHKKLGESELVNWLQTRARELGANLESSSARLLLERDGDDMFSLNNYVELLALEGGIIDNQRIKSLVVPSPKETIFMLLDAAVSGHVARAIEIYEQLKKQGSEGPYITSMLAWQLQNILAVKSASQRGDQEIASSLKMAPFVVMKTRRLASKFSFQKLKELINELVELDISLKSTPADERLQVKQFMLRMAEAK